jgi:KDO2-lipid IV(A) lauroyltransferase
MSCFGRYRLRALYRPLKDPFFNRLFLRFRSHLGGEMIPMQQVARHMLTKSPAPVCTAFIADQTPPPETAFWTNFLHQDTPFFTGYATLGNKTGLPVIMVTLRKIRRGYYTATIDLLTENAAEIAPADLVALYAQKLEASIEEQPAYWLWSHKRWKHKRVVKDEF